MKKEQIFKNMHLVPMGLLELDEHLTRPGGIFDQDHEAAFKLTSDDGGQWLFASFDDFLPEYEPLLHACYERSRPDFDVRILNRADRGYLNSTVTVIAPDQQTIDDIFNIVEKYREQSLFFPPNPDEEPSPEKAAPAQSQTQASQPVILKEQPTLGRMKNPDRAMRKTQTFKHMQLVRRGLKELDQYLTCQGGIFGDPHSSLFEIVYPDGTRREFDKSPAFLAEYFPLFFARYQRTRPGFEVNIVNFSDPRDLYSTVSVLAQDRRTIHDIFDIIEKYHSYSTLLSADPGREAGSLYACIKHEREKAAPSQSETQTQPQPAVSS